MLAEWKESIENKSRMVRPKVGSAKFKQVTQQEMSEQETKQGLKRVKEIMDK
jgi:hypothetical protein